MIASGAIGADLITLAAHKIGEPKGVGALIRRNEDIHFLEPLIRGGGQERGLRSGTENIAGTEDFRAAAAAAGGPFCRRGRAHAGASTWEGCTLPEEQAAPEENGDALEIEGDHRSLHAPDRE